MDRKNLSPIRLANIPYRLDESITSINDFNSTHVSSFKKFDKHELEKNLHSTSLIRKSLGIPHSNVKFRFSFSILNILNKLFHRKF
jgi:hypothetical protein